MANAEASDAPHFSNLARFYGWRYDQALEAWDAKDYDECYGIAAELLLEADLPVFFEAGCHLFLADEGYSAIEHATEALRLYKEMADRVPDSDKHRELVGVAERALSKAQELGDRELSDEEEDVALEGEVEKPSDQSAMVDEGQAGGSGTAGSEKSLTGDYEDKESGTPFIGESQESQPGHLYGHHGMKRTRQSSSPVAGPTPAASRNPSENTNKKPKPHHDP